MSPATTMGAKPADAKQAGAPQLVVPFTRAAKKHIESFLDQSFQIGAAAIPVGPIDVPAYGFIRGIWIELTATGGVGGAANVAKKADAPYSVLDSLSLSDVNGSPLFGPVPGYEAYLIDKFGGYFPGNPDPKRHPDFSDVASGAGASGNFTTLLYLPIEVGGRDGLGALANMNGASTYKLNFTVAASGQIYATAPATTLPTLRVRCWLDAWTQPTDTDLNGNPQAQTPPAHGTTSYWSRQVFQIAAAGQTPLRLSKVGNLIRNHFFIWRDATGARTNVNFPAPLNYSLDTRLLKSYQAIVWRGQMAQRFGFSGADEAAGALNAGVFVEDFTHDFDGRAGYELRDLWLQTAQNTRLDLDGNFGAAGTLTVVTNDVSAVGEVYV